MITSVVHRGLIYAGDTLLSSSIDVVQTGPMQLTVRAGSFTTTGQSWIGTYHAPEHGVLVATGQAKLLPDGRRIRIWLQGLGGLPVVRSWAYVLSADYIVNLTSDPIRTVAYVVDLVGQDQTADVWVKRKIVGIGEYGAPPAGWMKLHELVFEFLLPPGTSNLTPVEMYVLRVRSGFPPGTGPDDWKMQMGTG